MVLNTVAEEYLGSSIVPMNWKRDGHGALGILDPVTFANWNLEIIGDLIELLASHVEGRVIVNLHGAEPNRAQQVWVVFLGADRSQSLSEKRAGLSDRPYSCKGLPTASLSLSCRRIQRVGHRSFL